MLSSCSDGGMSIGSELYSICGQVISIILLKIKSEYSYGIRGLDELVERVLSMHGVASLIPERSIEDMVALIAQLGERHTEGTIIRYLKALCSIRGKSTFTFF